MNVSDPKAGLLGEELVQCGHSARTYQMLTCSTVVITWTRIAVLAPRRGLVVARQAMIHLNSNSFLLVFIPCKSLKALPSIIP